RFEQDKERVTTLSEGNLERQRTNFLRKYDQNQKIFEQSLKQQEVAQNKDLLNKKLEFVQAFDKYQTRTKDPFYDVQWIRAQLVEKPDHFEVYAAIPEHEVKNIRVRVGEDKITLTGKRSI